jgi:glycosyltransferase involved in cell wall biosynthesis
VNLRVSLVIPTIGRTELLRDCLQSVAAGTTRPAEVVLVDQSDGEGVARLIADLPSLRIRRVASDARNIAIAYNVGIRAAREEIVAVTHDDCTVAADWLEVGVRTVAQRTDLLATGRVMPDGDADRVPSCKTSEEAGEWRGKLEVSLLFPANMVVRRSELLAIGGFNEAFARAAEDGDLSFRWLRRGARCAMSRR